MDLIDVETELRSHLATRPVPRAPGDLAERTRVRHRRQRRQQAAMVGVGLAVALVFGSIPVLREVLPGVGTTEDAAAPSTARLPSLYDLPPRGSLADDADWLTEAAALPWTEVPGTTSDATPPGGSHRVLYAADLPGARVALVMGKEGALLSTAWFTGPTGAPAAEMTQATSPARAYPDQPLVLLDVPAGGDRGVLVVVSRPGDQIAYVQGQLIAADGSSADDVVQLDVQDGVGVAAVPEPGSVLGAGEVRIRRDGEQVYDVRGILSDRALAAAAAAVELGDPRGRRSAVDESALQSTAQWALSSYGSGAEGVTPVVLAAGRVGGDGDPQVTLIGLTFPSGATVLWASRFSTTADGAGTGSTTSVDPVAAGAPLLDRTAAVRVSGALAVTAPAAATTAVVLASDGTTITTVPLTAGSGVTAVPPSPAPPPFRVRVLDAAGTPLAEAQVQGTG